MIGRVKDAWEIVIDLSWKRYLKIWKMKTKLVKQNVDELNVL